MVQTYRGERDSWDAYTYRDAPERESVDGFDDEYRDEDNFPCRGYGCGGEAVFRKRITDGDCFTCTLCGAFYVK